NMESLRAFRDRFAIPIDDEDLASVPYYKPDENSPEMRYMREQRRKLGGCIPARRSEAQVLPVPGLDAFSAQIKSSGERQVSTTMAFVRILSALAKDKAIGHRVVPIVPDEARTFGMEGMFRQLGIYSSVGQRYTPHDSDQIMFYKEDIKGQILEEGINEAGAGSAWLAAATSYSTSNFPMVPFYIFYSMFGFQRIGDLLWAAGDSQARGFLMGATSGRTTLNGEGLQHQDGHSLLLASTIPNCVSYDPTYAYELAVIIQDGMRRMYSERENRFYYITTMNENYPQPAMPEGVETGIVKGMYRLKSAEGDAPRVRLCGAGTILREVEAAAEMLRNDYGVDAEVWSLPSINELQRDIKQVERWNMLNPGEESRTAFFTEQLQGSDAPVVIATDYMKSFSEQLRSACPAPLYVLGTDGFGRSDTRAKLRHFFEVSREFVVLASLNALAARGDISAEEVATARDALGIDPNKVDPTTI
ncbi:transketolase-like TK C-terminal-containing protein, partial [Congregibacter sp.]|uniref:transketolase-like TK C-terminal-containing protein n=1 Tax=Congregibacter sp. TaxID=2744308 RepID=UPI00385B375E